MESGKPQPVVVARFFRSVGERVLGRPHKTIELTEGMAEAASSMWSLANLSALSLVRGVALAEVGRIEDAMALLNQGIEVCEKFGAVLRVGALYNSLGYCYQQIYQHRQAWKLNLRSEEIAREMMEKHPTGRRLYAEIVSQANVNLMENLFEQGRDDEAWDRIESLKRESKSEDYDILRFVWESRMSCLEAQILLRRNELGRAENLIQDSLQHARRHALNKREGCLLRLLGEVQSRQGESDAAVSNLKEAIGILKDVGNRRQLWQAHASLASAYETLDRTSDARQQWGAAAEVIHNTANGLSDRQLRHGFLEAQPVREILARAES
jgi:tetratricopeptide (TPR) repeat protein